MSKVVSTVTSLTHTEQSVRKTVLEDHGFKLGEQIGKGSYAKVKKAYSEEHKSMVAVKIISKHKAPEEYISKFVPREVEVVKGLRHINLISFYQSIETTHRFYIIMEYAANGSLLDRIKKNHFISEPEAKTIFQQLINALEYCHSRHVVHRDIKCENLLFDKNDCLKIIDFGFARNNVESNGTPVLSETYCGSYAYACPEILKGIPYRPEIADIWASGVVLYATLYGQLPFNDSNFAHLLKQVQNKVNFPRERNVSTTCKNLISKILTPQSTLRPDIKTIKRDEFFLTIPSVMNADRTQLETMPNNDKKN